MSDSEKRPIQVDKYEQKAPENWGEVKDRSTSALMRICVAVPELLAVTFEGAIRIVRGITSLPIAVVRRIAPRVEEAHGKSREEEQQRQLEHKEGQVVLMQDAVDNLQAIVDGFRAKGLAVEIKRLEDGRVVLALAAPDAVGDYLDAAEGKSQKRVTGEKAEDKS